MQFWELSGPWFFIKSWYGKEVCSVVQLHTQLCFSVVHWRAMSLTMVPTVAKMLRQSCNEWLDDMNTTQQFFLTLKWLPNLIIIYKAYKKPEPGHPRLPLHPQYTKTTVFQKEAETDRAQGQTLGWEGGMACLTENFCLCHLSAKPVGTLPLIWTAAGSCFKTLFQISPSFFCKESPVCKRIPYRSPCSWCFFLSGQSNAQNINDLSLSQPESACWGGAGGCKSPEPFTKPLGQAQFPPPVCTAWTSLISPAAMINDSVGKVTSF